MERPRHAGLRHLALNVTRLDEMKTFYVDLLGFAVEWQPDDDNIYLSSGIDNLALHRSTSPTAGRSTSVTADRSTEGSHSGDSLDHLGLIVRVADDVDRWADYLEAHGVAIDARPKTHRDGARSCYFRDPDGNRIQIIHHPPISTKV